jgi:hypothetical protein
MLFAKAAWRVPRRRSVQLLGEPIQWVDTVCYLGFTLYSRLIWLPNIIQVGQKISQGLGLLGPLLNRRSGLSIRNGVLLYKQLILPMMDHICTKWRSATRIQVRARQVLQSMCLRIAARAYWYNEKGKFARIWGFIS